jgi:hypothetical protein
MRKFTIVLLGMLLLAFPANAGWNKTAAGTDGNCKFPEKNICYYTVTGNGNTEILDTRTCENWSWWFISNVASQAHTTTVQVRWSIDFDTASLNTSEPLGPNLTGDAVAGLDAVNGYDAPAIYGVIANSDAGVGRIAVQCFPRK